MLCARIGHARSDIAAVPLMQDCGRRQVTSGSGMSCRVGPPQSELAAMSAGLAGAVAACWYTTACGKVGSSTCSTSLSPCPPFASCKPPCRAHRDDEAAVAPCQTPVGLCMSLQTLFAMRFHSTLSRVFRNHELTKLGFGDRTKPAAICGQARMTDSD